MELVEGAGEVTAATDTYMTYDSSSNLLKTVVDGVDTTKQYADGSFEALGKHTIQGLSITNAGRIKNTTRATSTYIVLSTDYTIFANTDGGDWTLSLPAGIEGAEYEILLTGASGNTLTMAPNGIDKLFGFNADFDAYDYEGFTIKFNSVDGWR